VISEWAIIYPNNIFSIKTTRVDKMAPSCIAKLLIGQYSELSKKSKAKFPLHDAIVSSKTSLVGKLLKNKKTPVDSLCNGFSPLGFATAVGNTEVTKLLLEKGADLNLKDDKYGLSPLIHAVMGNFPEIVRLLLKAGAKIDICSSQGDSTLKVAAEANNIDIARILISSGANLELPNKEGFTILQHVAIDNYVEMATLLIDSGAKIDKKNRDGRTALMYAAKEGHLEMVDLLVKKGARVNLQDVHGFSALIAAVMENHTTVAELLVGAAAELNVQTKESWTPVMYAIIKNNIHLVKLFGLLDARLDVKNSCGHTAKMIAYGENNAQMLKLLEEEEAKGKDLGTFDMRAFPKTPGTCSRPHHSDTSRQKHADAKPNHSESSKQKYADARPNLSASHLSMYDEMMEFNHSQISGAPLSESNRFAYLDPNKPSNISDLQNRADAYKQDQPGANFSGETFKEIVSTNLKKYGYKDETGSSIDTLKFDHPSAKSSNPGETFEEFILTNLKNFGIIEDEDESGSTSSSEVDQEKTKLKACFNCEDEETVGEAFKTCSRCKYARYCSKECQRCDWSQHKASCKKMAEATEANASSFPSAAGVKIAKQQISSDDSDETNAVTVPVSTLFTALKKTLIQRKPKFKYCFNCFEEEPDVEKLWKCVCKAARYCSKECHEEDWIDHMDLCLQTRRECEEDKKDADGEREEKEDDDEEKEEEGDGEEKEGEGEGEEKEEYYRNFDMEGVD